MFAQRLKEVKKGVKSHGGSSKLQFSKARSAEICVTYFELSAFYW